MSHRFIFRTAGFLFLAFCLTGCGSNAILPSAPSRGDTQFWSAPPGGAGGYRNDLAEDSSNEPQSLAQETEPERIIEEADIVKVESSILYALNSYRGLYIIDISHPDSPRKLGHLDVFGDPVEMYVRDDRVYIILSNYFYVWSLAEDSAQSELGSSVTVVDVAEKTAPLLLSRFHVKGYITDTRIVGDVLYTVSNTYSWFWYYGDYEAEDTTQVVSINIADPFDIHVVDRHSFDRCQGWDNQIHVTTEAIYVASSCYEYDGYATQIRYVNISNPEGQLGLGAEIHMPGVVMDRWSLSQHQDILRVITSDGWWSGSAPKLSTFRVVSPSRIVPLASLTLQIPEPESLTAARFDGSRAYLVTYRQVDPLFTVDLSDPENPVQAGELTMPGWLDHIVPRGDRLIALGHDDSSQETVLAVSLFDVSDIHSPSMLARVTVGEGWGWLTDERNNYDKVFKVLDDQGLILLPFMQYVQDGDYWHYTGGVQLVDFTRDTLTRRGHAPHEGCIRRAFIASNRLFTLSDQKLEVLDIADRDNPALKASLSLSRNVNQFVVMGQYGIQLVGDWWSGDTQLVVVPLSDPDLGDPVAELTLRAPYARLFTFGEHVVALFRDNETSRLKLLSIDLTDPRAPFVAGTLELPEDFWYYGYYYGWWWWDFGYYYPRFDEVVQSGSSLVFHAVRYWYNGCTECDPDEILVVDLSDPSSPVLASRIPLANRPWVAGLTVAGSKVLFTHYVEAHVSGYTSYTWVRYYMNVLDVADPYNPALSAPVNVPGIVQAADLDRKLVYTVDYQWVLPEGTTRRSLNISSLVGGMAVLRGTLDLPDEAGRVVISGERAVFATNRWWYDETAQQYLNESALAAADLKDPDDPVLASWTVLPVPYASVYLTVADKAIIGTWWYVAGLLIYDVSDLSSPSFQRHMRTRGWLSDLTLAGSTLYGATGPYGVVTLPLD